MLDNFEIDALFTLHQFTPIIWKEDSSCLFNFPWLLPISHDLFTIIFTINNFINRSRLLGRQKKMILLTACIKLKDICIYLLILCPKLNHQICFAICFKILLYSVTTMSRGITLLSCLNRENLWYFASCQCTTWEILSMSPTSLCICISDFLKVFVFKRTIKFSVSGWLILYTHMC